MKKRGFQKSYDVKTFLNQKKSAKSFVSFTLTGSSFKSIGQIASFLVFVFVALSILSAPGIRDTIFKNGVENALVLFTAGDDEYSLNFEDMFCYNASALIGFKDKTKTPKTTEDKSPEPKVEIDEQTVRTGGVQIKNETDFSVDPISILGEDTKKLKPNSKVLIVHTHGSESYTSSKKYRYEHTGNYRTQNTDFNMLRVGEELANALKSKGISVIHDKTINDYPSYNDSYNKTERIIKKHLEEDSQIEFVFDIHRDAVGSEDKIVKFVSDIDGKTAAQVMIVCGTDTNLENPLWRENLNLAVHIQNHFNINCPGFLRPINLRKERFNMHLTTGSLLFEVGTNGNTLEEALYSARILGEGIGEFINSKLN